MSLIVDIEKKLKDMTLKIAFETAGPGQVTGILGASGCGKSVTLKCIAGIMTPDKGKIILNGRILFDSDKKIQVRPQERHAGYLFQSYALFPNMTVQQNVELVLAGTKPERAETAMKYLELLHVADLAKNNPQRLSGGQQQRVALARILASNPDVLMLDEPFSALDYYLKEKLQIELMETLKEYRGEILMVTHNRDEIYRLCSQMCVLDQGRVVTAGATGEVFQNPGTVAAAKLTGCKNIEKVQVLSGHTLSVPAWNMVLKLKKEIPAGTDAIGIRAHYFRRLKPGEGGNRLLCRCRQLLEDPFEVTVILENGIWWKIPKDVWAKDYGCQVPEQIIIPDESILFLRQEARDGENRAGASGSR